MERLKVLSDTEWAGPNGGCGNCGDPDVVPRLVRWWDPDEGWKVGALCPACKEREILTPDPDDFAYAKLGGEGGVVHEADKIDIAVDAFAGDLDGVYAEFRDWTLR